MENTPTNIYPGHAALRRGRVSIPGQVYHLTVTTRLRKPVFVDFGAACEAARCFEDAAMLGDSRMLAWVLMPDHAHWLLQLGELDSLTRIVVRLKSSSSRKANRVLGTKGSLWSRAFHDHALREEEELVSVARYIVANPIRAGIVSRIGDYPFWNATWL